MQMSRRILSLLLAMIMMLGFIPVAIAADPFNIVEARLVTEVFNLGETITAIRIEYNDEIWCGSIMQNDTPTYVLTNGGGQSIVSVYVNNSGKKDDVQIKGRYVFLNLSSTNQDPAERINLAYQKDRSTRFQPLPYAFSQNTPITSVNGRVAPRIRPMTTAVTAMTAKKDAALPPLTDLGPDVREIRTADTEVRVTLENFRSFEYTNPVTGTILKFHLMIPSGYDALREGSTNEPLPMITIWPNGGDMNYVDDYHVADSEKRYMGGLFNSTTAVWVADKEAQDRSPSFVLCVSGTVASNYGTEGRPAASWGNWLDRSPMQQDYLAVIRWIKDRFNVDVDHVSAVSLAASASAPLGTILSEGVDDFSALILTAYDTYHALCSGNLATNNPWGDVIGSTYESRLAYAETVWSRLMNKVATWQLNGLDDDTGGVAGDTTYTNIPYARMKGERNFDLAYRMNKAAGKTVIVSNTYDTMWNGMINSLPISRVNQNLSGPESDNKALAQWAEAREAGTDHLVSVYMPETSPVSNHWPWGPAYQNRGVYDWVIAQDRTEIGTYAIGPGAPDYTPQSPRALKAGNEPELPDAGTARVVEARLVTEVLDWGETITAVRVEYSEEIMCASVEKNSGGYGNYVNTYKMINDRHITNVYVNNSGKKDDYQTQGKYVFINLGLSNQDATAYRDHIVFETSLRIRPRCNPYMVQQTAPVFTVNGNVVQPVLITTAVSAIRGTLMNTEDLPNIEQMDVWSTEVRMDIDDFRSFRYTNPADNSVTKFHLYIPEGYEKQDDSLENIPLIVHFPSGDTAYVDDVLGNADASRQMGALFTHPDASIWGSEAVQAKQKAFVLTPGPNWNANYMPIVKALMENLNVDASRVYAISLAAGTTPQWNTILANPGVFAAQITTAYDPYHSYAGGSAPYAERMQTAEDTFARILDETPGWFFAGLMDSTGTVSGDPLARRKGERLRDIGYVMEERGYNVDVAWGEEGELMINGLLRGEKAAAAGQAQVDRANAKGAKYLFTPFIPNTNLQSEHWSWNGAYNNPAVYDWLFAQSREAEKQPFDLVVNVLEWGSATTAVIVDMGEAVNSGDIDLDTFAVLAETRDPGNDDLIYEGPRTITNAYVSETNEKGVPADSGRYVVLELKYGFNNTLPEIDGCAALIYRNGNNWLKQTYTVTQEKAVGEIAAGSAYRYNKTVTPIYDDFELVQNPVEGYTDQSYRVYTPDGAAGPLPLVLWIHGGGESYNAGSGGNESAQLFANNGGVAWVMNAPDDCVVLAPQRGIVEGSPGYSEAGVVAFIRDLIAKGVVDESRVYVSGLSAPGSEPTNYPLRFPGLFAAAVQMCRGGAAFTEEQLALLKDFPIWFIHGRYDPVSNYQGTINGVNSLLSAGSTVARASIFPYAIGTQAPGPDYEGALEGTEGNYMFYSSHWSWILALNNYYVYADDRANDAAFPMATFPFTNYNVDKDTGIMDWLFAQSKAEAAEPAITGLQYTGFTNLVSGYNASIPVEVTTQNAGSLKVFAGVYLDGVLRAQAEVIGGRAVIKLAGLYDFSAASVKAWFEGAEPSIETDIPVKVAVPSLWEPTAAEAEGIVVVTFAENIGLSAKKSATVRGAAAGKMAIVDGNKLEITGYGPAVSGRKVVVTGVKYPQLFPSYSFTFTVQLPEADKATLLYQGHGSLRITTKEGKVIYIDPYAGVGYDVPADLILVTHGHGDHTAVNLITTQNPGCETITFTEALVTPGTYQTFNLGFVTVEAVQAGNNPNHNINACVGFILTFSDGKSVYISGDTSTTEQMATFAERKLDYAFFCCDGRYNMGMDEAIACANLVKARHSIPYHIAPGSLFDRARAELFTAEGAMIVADGEVITID